MWGLGEGMGRGRVDTTYTKYAIAETPNSEHDWNTAMSNNARRTILNLHNSVPVCVILGRYERARGDTHTHTHTRTMK